MSTAHDAALAFCLSTYSASGSATSATKTKGDKPASKVRASVPSTFNGSVMAPASNADKPRIVRQAIQSGTMDAATFLVAMRRAKNREECQAVIAAYVGYDHTAPYGEQDSRARSKAQLEMNPVTSATKAHNRGASVSSGGFTSGMPEQKVRHLQNLFGRERLAIEAMNAHREASKKSTNDHECNLYAGLAQVEAERLSAIRADLEMAQK